jgi:ACT domain-containing protein
MAETTAQTIRENKVIQVMQLTNQGESVKDACKKVGISRSSYYEFQKDYPAFMHFLHQTLINSSMEQLVMILLSRVQLLQMVLEDGMKDDTKPMERLAIYKESEYQLEKLAATLRIDNPANTQAAMEVLAGPVLIPGKSRFSISDHT